MQMSEITTSVSARKLVRKRLRTWMRKATTEEINQGLNWYSEAQEFCHDLAITYGVSGEVAAGVVSALSPNNKWNRNKFDAIQVFQAVKDGKSANDVKVCTYGANKRKAFEIAQGNEKLLRQSPKTYAFARNVGALDPNHVTIDKWHLRACQTTSENPVSAVQSCTPKQYEVLEEETLKVAKEFGMSGYAFQAVVWVTIKNRWNR
jgi:hypothetical protein